MSDVTPLSAESWGDFKEVGNIGAGNAAARLADVIRRRCIIGLPDVFSADIQTLISNLETESSSAVAILSGVAGDLPSTILVFLKRQHAHTIVRHATHNGIDGSGKTFNFTAQFALQQLADALAESFTGGVNELFGIKTKRGAGRFIVETVEKTAEETLKRMPSAGSPPLAISCDFYDVERSFEGKFMYFLDAAAQEKARNLMEQLLQK